MHFDAAIASEIDERDIFALRTSIPNFIVNKCTLYLNRKFEINMHSIGFLVPTNSVQYVKQEDDYQIIQSDNLSYAAVHFVALENIVYVYLNVGTLSDYLKSFIMIRYPGVVEISIKLCNVHGILNSIEFSGIWSVSYVTDLLNGVSIDLENGIEKERLLQWFFNFVQHESIICSPC